MNTKNISLGTPEECNVVIEIPMGSANKYEIDPTTGLLMLDFVYRDGFHFPFNYGYITQTKAEDGDPLDACVFSSHPIVPLTLVTVKPIAMLKLKDNGEQDNKLICIPLPDPLAAKYNDLSDLTAAEQSDIAEFFHQVGVQKHKTMDMEGFVDRAAEIEEINHCRLNL